MRLIQRPKHALEKGIDGNERLEWYTNEADGGIQVNKSS